jgi:hypothetical protein
VPNNPNPVTTSVNISPQQLIVATTNILPTTDAPTFADPVGEFFRILKKFVVKSSKKNLQLATFSQEKDETLKMFYRRLLKLERIPRASQTWKLSTGIFIRWKVLQHSMRRFCNEFLQKIWRLVHFAGCVQHFRKAGTSSCTL